MARSTCARHEFTPAVPHVAFRSTGHHYAHGSVLLIGKSSGISFENGGTYLSVLVVKSTNAIAALWPCLAQSNASSAKASVPLAIISMRSNLAPSTSAGEKFDCLAFLFSNLLLDI